LNRLTSVPGDAVAVERALFDGKFRAPTTWPGIVHRERLTMLIDQAVERPVTVITAPPGAGKTVACAGWAAARSRARRIAWLNLDEGDRDPAQFWACVTAALATGGTVLGVPLVPLVRQVRSDLPSDLVDTVRNLSRPVVLVIDDVHLLADSEVLPGLAQLIHRAPGSLRLILCGRLAPGLHLAKMRLNGYLSELQAPDLACTTQEAAAYLDVLGLPATAVNRGQLLQATEGWMAGPRLAALIAARDGYLNVEAVAADPIVTDYIQDEILNRQPPGVRRFLRRTSVAERLTPAFADLLAEGVDSTRILDTLVRENNLVCPDREGGYRYHPFLRQVLLGELRRETAAEIPGLFTKASRWAATQGDVIEAVRCLTEAADWDSLPRLLTEAGLAGALPDRAEELEKALGRLPADRRAEPACMAALAMVRLCRHDPDSALAYLDRAARSHERGGQGGLVIDLWLAMLHLMRQADDVSVACCRSLAEQARASAGSRPEHQALGLLWLALGTALLWRCEAADAVTALTAADHQLTAAGTDLLALRARGWLALAEALSGELAAATELSVRLRDAAPSDPPATCLATIAGAQVAIEQDDLMLAQQLLDRVDPAMVCPLPGEPDVAVLLAMTRARVALAEGDTGRAGDLARLAREKCERAGQLLTMLDFCIALRAGDLDGAAGALGAVPCGAGRGQGHEPISWPAARAGLLLAQGDPAQALAVASAVLCGDADGGAGRPPALALRERVATLLTAAVSARRKGKDQQAATLLEEALVSAEPHNLYRPFLEGGGAVHSALAMLVAPSSLAAGFAACVHTHFFSQPSSRASGSVFPGYEAPTLTASELAVLRLLRSYMSNQDIADTLFLSVNTVKTHLRSVYYKLGVSSRREAVERGVRLQILTPGREGSLARRPWLSTSSQALASSRGRPAPGSSTVPLGRGLVFTRRG
jgi:LuxR family transcriptional regulator, maltose regulon positive regulatory protein